jgi:hypothetical protein
MGQNQLWSTSVPSSKHAAGACISKSAEASPMSTRPEKLARARKVAIWPLQQPDCLPAWLPPGRCPTPGSEKSHRLPDPPLLGNRWQQGRANHSSLLLAHRVRALIRQRSKVRRTDTTCSPSPVRRWKGSAIQFVAVLYQFWLPATCLVVALRRLKRLVVAIMRIKAASPCSS